MVAAIKISRATQDPAFPGGNLVTPHFLLLIRQKGILKPGGKPSPAVMPLIFS